MFVYNKSMYIMRRILCTSTCALKGWFGKNWQVGTVSQVMLDCCICISFAMCSGLVSMLFLTSMMQATDVVSNF